MKKHRPQYGTSLPELRSNSKAIQSKPHRLLDRLRIFLTKNSGDDAQRRPAKYIQNLSLFLFALCTSSTAHAGCHVHNGEVSGDCSGVTVIYNGKEIPTGGKATVQQSVTVHKEVNKEPIVVTGLQTERGVIHGATVKEGGELRLYGISNGDITVAKGATLIVEGQVKGRIVNNGGNVTVKGIAASIENHDGGSVTVSGIVNRMTGDGS